MTDTRNIRIGASAEVAERLGIEKGTTLGALSVIVAGDGTPYVNFVTQGKDGQVAPRQFGPNDKESQWGTWRDVMLYDAGGNEIGRIGFNLPQPGEDKPFQFGIYDLEAESGRYPEGHESAGGLIPIQWAVSGDGAGHYDLNGEELNWESMHGAGHKDRRGQLNLDSLEGIFLSGKGHKSDALNQEQEQAQERHAGGGGFWKALTGQSFNSMFGGRANDIQVADVESTPEAPERVAMSAEQVNKEFGSVFRG